MLIRSASEDDIKPGTMILWIGEPLRSYWLTMTIVKTTNTDNVNYYECVKTFIIINCYLIKCISDTGIECVVFSKEKTFNTNIAGFLSGFWTHIKLSNT